MKHGTQWSNETRLLALSLSALCAVGLAGCGGDASAEGGVMVQTVSQALGLESQDGELFTGVVQSQSVQKVARDSNKQVAECYVSVGDVVAEGDPLFTYDVQALELDVQTKELEIDQLKNSITNYDTQIKQLEQEKKSAGKDEQLSYTLQIQTVQKDQAEAQYNLKQKEAELEVQKASLEDTTVAAGVSGVVQAISEEDAAAYITIQQTGAYIIKGTANELNVSWLYEGEEMTVLSRVDDGRWSGTITEVDTGSTAEESAAGEYTMMNDSGSGETATKYSFYVNLEDSEGLMMGQHVYLTPYFVEEREGIWMPSFYLGYEEDGSAYVWSADGGKLCKKTVELGDYDAETDTYQVAGGLTEEDYLAFPEEGLKAGQAVSIYSETMLGEGDYFDSGETSSDMMSAGAMARGMTASAAEGEAMG